jgi:hypothetical protein
MHETFSTSIKLSKSDLFEGVINRVLLQEPLTQEVHGVIRLIRDRSRDASSQGIAYKCLQIRGVVTSWHSRVVPGNACGRGLVLCAD